MIFFKKKNLGGPKPPLAPTWLHHSQITDCFVSEEKNSSKTSEMKIYV